MRRQAKRRGILRRGAGVCDRESHEQQTTVIDLHQGHADVSKQSPTRLRMRHMSNRHGEGEEWAGGANETPPDYSKDWKRIAEIFDRLFFYLFAFAFVVSTLILFHPLTMSERHSGDSNIT